jgi:putative DNA methylase
MPERRSRGQVKLGTLEKLLDPFAGGGSIPLEAQRLGLEAHASDLNPVAVLINKALIEIPPKFAGCPPVNPESRKTLLQHEWKGVQGLAEDVRYYGKWMRDEAWKRIGHLYPKVQISQEYGGGEATVIAWLWARTVKCPNPACGAQMPLVRSFALSKNKRKEAHIKPIVDWKSKTVRFAVIQGPGAVEATVNRNGATCIVCGSSVPLEHVRTEGRAGRMGARLMAIVADSKSGRIYLPAFEEDEALAIQATNYKAPETELPEQALGFRVQLYGLRRHRDLFTPRQLMALTTFSDLVDEAHERVQTDGGGDVAYADAVATYLAFLVDKQADLANSLNRWEPVAQCPRQLFARQAIPMVWDFAESNPLGGSSGSWVVLLDNLMRSFRSPLFDFERISRGFAKQEDATGEIIGLSHPVVSTDPPYYDNVPYADLSDFFYVWLRRSIGRLYPQLFYTLLTPKGAELVAEPFRHGGRERAERFFEDGLGQAFSRIWEVQHKSYPVAVYYAFKQAETEDEDIEDGDSASASTGWETMLEGHLH